jgi:hypothetical protein
MQQERQQMEAKHRRRQILLAVANVMLKMVALGLEYVVIVVFNLPPSTTGLGHLDRMLCTETVIGDKGIVIELFTRFGIAHGHLAPMD